MCVCVCVCDRAPDIPANASLVYKVQLTDIQTISEPSEMMPIERLSLV